MPRAERSPSIPTISENAKDCGCAGLLSALGSAAGEGGDGRGREFRSGQPLGSPDEGTTTMKSLESFEFTAPVGKAEYEWDKLLDGGIYQLAEGDDYHCKTATFRVMAAKQARKKGNIVRVNKVEGGLVIQAVEATAEQLAKWATEESDGQQQKPSGETRTEPEVPPQSAQEQPSQERPSKGKRSKK
jgi:hypothetical protein